MNFSKELVAAPVLNVWQPWATPIVLGLKDIENRNYAPPYYGLVFVYATKTLRGMRECNPAYNPPNGFAGTPIADLVVEKAESTPNMSLMEYGYESLFPLGAILGTVEITDVVKESRSPWFYGPYGWVLQNPRFIKPVPWTGSQGFKYRKPIILEVEFFQYEIASDKIPR